MENLKSKMKKNDMKKKRRTLRISGEENVRDSNDDTLARDDCPSSTTSRQHLAEENLTLSEASLNVDRLKSLLQREREVKIELSDLELTKDTIEQCLTSDFYLETDSSTNHFDLITELLRNEKQIKKDEHCLREIKKSVRELYLENEEEALVVRLKRLLEKEKSLEHEINKLESIIQSQGEDISCMGHLTELLNQQDELKGEIDNLRITKTSLEDCMRFGIQHAVQLLENENKLHHDMRNLENVKETLKKYIKTDSCRHNYLAYLTQLLQKEKDLREEINDLDNMKDALRKCGQNTDFARLLQLLQNEDQLQDDILNLDTKKSAKTPLKGDEEYLKSLRGKKEDQITKELCDLKNITNDTTPPNWETVSLQPKLVGTNKHVSHSELVPDCSMQCILKSEVSIVNRYPAKCFEIDRQKNEEQTSTDDNLQHGEANPQELVQNGGSNNEDSIYFECIKKFFQEEIQLDEALSGLKELNTSIKTRIKNRSCNKDRRYSDVLKQHLEVKLKQEDPAKRLEKDQQKSKEQNSTCNNLEYRETNPQMVYQNGGSNNEDPIGVERMKPLFQEELDLGEEVSDLQDLQSSLQTVLPRFQEELQLDAEVSDLKKLETSLKTRIQNPGSNKDRTYSEVSNQHLEDNVKLKQEDPAKRLEKDQQKNKEQNSTCNNLEYRETNSQMVYQNGGSNNEDPVYVERMKPLFQEELDLGEEVSDLTDLQSSLKTVLPRFQEELQLGEEVSDLKKLETSLKTRIQNPGSKKDRRYSEVSKQHLEFKVKLKQEDPTKRPEKGQRKNKEQNSTYNNLECRETNPQMVYQNSGSNNEDPIYVERMKPLFQEELDLGEEVSDLTDLQSSLKTVLPRFQEELKLDEEVSDLKELQSSIKTSIQLKTSIQNRGCNKDRRYSKVSKKRLEDKVKIKEKSPAKRLEKGKRKNSTCNNLEYLETNSQMVCQNGGSGNEDPYVERMKPLFQEKLDLDEEVSDLTDLQSSLKTILPRFQEELQLNEEVSDLKELQSSLKTSIQNRGGNKDKRYSEIPKHHLEDEVKLKQEVSAKRLKKDQQKNKEENSTCNNLEYRETNPQMVYQMGGSNEDPIYVERMKPLFQEELDLDEEVSDLTDLQSSLKSVIPRIQEELQLDKEVSGLKKLQSSLKTRIQNAGSNKDRRYSKVSKEHLEDRVNLKQEDPAKRLEKGQQKNKEQNSTCNNLEYHETNPQMVYQIGGSNNEDPIYVERMKPLFQEELDLDEELSDLTDLQSSLKSVIPRIQEELQLGEEVSDLKELQSSLKTRIQNASSNKDRRYSKVSKEHLEDKVKRKQEGSAERLVKDQQKNKEQNSTCNNLEDHETNPQMVDQNGGTNNEDLIYVERMKPLFQAKLDLDEEVSDLTDLQSSLKTVLPRLQEALQLDEEVSDLKKLQSSLKTRIQNPGSNKDRRYSEVSKQHLEDTGKLKQANPGKHLGQDQQYNKEQNSNYINLEYRETNPQTVYQNGGSNNEDLIYVERIKPLLQEELQLDDEVSGLKELQSSLSTSLQNRGSNKDKRYSEALKHHLEDNVKLKQHNAGKHLEEDQQKNKEQNYTYTNVEYRVTKSQMVYQNGGSNNEDLIYVERMKLLFKEEIQLDEEISDLKELQSSLKTRIENRGDNKDKRYSEIPKHHLEDEVKLKQEVSANRLKKDQQKNKEQNSTFNNLEYRETNPQTVYQNGGSNNEDSIYLERIKPLFQEELRLDEEVSDLKEIQSSLKTRIQNAGSNKDRRYSKVSKEQLEDKVKLKQEDPAKRLEKGQQKNKEQTSTCNNLANKEDSIYLERLKPLFQEELQLDEEVSDLKELQSSLKTRIQNRGGSKDKRYSEISKHHLEDEEKFKQEDPAKRLKNEQQKNKKQNSSYNSLEYRETNPQMLYQNVGSNNEDSIYLERLKPLFHEELHLDEEVADLQKLQSSLKTRIQNRGGNKDKRYSETSNHHLEDKAQLKQKNKEQNTNNVECREKNPQTAYQNGGSNNEDVIYVKHIKPLFQEELQLDEEVSDLKELQSSLKTSIENRRGKKDQRYSEVPKHHLEDKVKLKQEDPAKRLGNDQQKNKEQNATCKNLDYRETNPQLVDQNSGSNNEDSVYIERVKQNFKEEIKLDEEVLDLNDLKSFLQTCIQYCGCNKDLGVLKQRLEEEQKLEQEISKLTKVKNLLDKSATKAQRRNSLTENDNNRSPPRSAHVVKTKDSPAIRQCASRFEDELLKKEQQLEKEICALNSLKAYFQQCKEASHKDIDDACYTKRLDLLLQMDAQYTKEIASLTQTEDTFRRSLNTGTYHEGKCYLERLQNLLRNERQLQSEVQELVDIEKVFKERLNRKPGGRDSRNKVGLRHLKEPGNRSKREKGNRTSVEPVCKCKLTSSKKKVKISQTKILFQHDPVVRKQDERQDDPPAKHHQNTKEIAKEPLILKHLDLQSRNSSLGDENEYLSDKLEELLMEQEHLEQSIGGPMARAIDRLNRRSAELQRNLDNRKRIVDASERSYERQSAKEDLIIAQKNISDLSFVNDELRREVLVLDQRCVRMEELLVNEKLNEINRYKSL